MFGFESKPDQGLLASKGSILKNMQVSTEDKERIWQIFYNPSQYESNKDLGEVVTQIYVALSGITGPGSRVVLFDRIKQYKSILLKLANVVSRLDNTPRVAVPDAETLIARAIALGDQIAADPIANFDDLIGFNVIIDDTDLDESGRSEALTNYSARVESLLSSHPELRISKIRKESRAPGFEAINLYVQGWLNHRNFGDLSIKIQFRFKTAMYRESAMYYSYKTYGRWEMPPWASKISFGEIKSFRELQQELVTNFKTYVAGVKSPARFSIGDRLQMPPGWPSSMDLYDLALTNDPDTSSSDENAAVEKLDFLGRQV